MDALDYPTDDFNQFRQLEHDYIGYQSLTDVPRVLNYQDELKDYSVSKKKLKMQATCFIIVFSISKVSQQMR